MGLLMLSCEARVNALPLIFSSSREFIFPVILIISQPSFDDSEKLDWNAILLTTLSHGVFLSP